MVRTLEQSTMRKVYLRLLPFAVLSYILAYIDRINVSFAGLTRHLRQRTRRNRTVASALPGQPRAS